MSDETLIPVTCTLRPETLSTIESNADKAGMKRSEYLRGLIVSALDRAPDDPSQVPPFKDSGILLEHIWFGLQCVHTTLYMMAGTSGALTTAQLEQVAADSKQRSLHLLATLDERIANTRRELTELRTGGPPVGQ